MRPRHLSRRALLAGGAAALTACSASGPPSPTTPAVDSPETRLLRELIADKERTIALYTSLIADGGDKLVPFRDRHQAHLDELRKHVPGGASPSAPPSAQATAPPSATPSVTPSAPPKPSLSRLRKVEDDAAELRTRQLATVSPGVAQLIASIGACEAAHAVALPRSL
ncbi:hypothetical protein [Nonomuraea maritima]|uniref:hypothetical protein n=1 Tax=Nonomuraea maritima TaxID=683260 RepID=UPI00371FAE9B